MGFGEEKKLLIGTSYFREHFFLAALDEVLLSLIIKKAEEKCHKLQDKLDSSDIKNAVL